jgi:hypothetical protein
MLVADVLNPPIQYDRIWFIIGLALVALIPIAYGVIIWLTRPKLIMSINDLRPIATGAELDRLKAKYLRLVERHHQSYLRKEIKLRELHRNLSMVVRYFVYEARHFPAPTMTLSDLKMTPYPALAELIELYYPEEFAVIRRGNAEGSVQAAKGFIQQWV